MYGLLELLCIPEGSSVERCGGSADGPWFACTGDGIELMQFTGLKTRSGQEVYECDILKTSTGRLLQVLWHEAAFCWDVLGLNSEGAPLSFSMLERYSFEIIGNIYENPELLPTKE